MAGHMEDESQTEKDRAEDSDLVHALDHAIARASAKIAFETNTKDSGLNNPLFTGIFRVLVPLLLGGILTYAAAISSAQTEQLKTISSIQGQLSGMVQANADYNRRMTDLSQAISDMQSILNAQGNRITTLEAVRHK